MGVAGFSGKKLRALRLARGLTQAELAHRAHVRERQIIRWENNQHIPRVESISSLARVLNANVSELLTAEAEEDDEESDPVATLVNAIRALVRIELAAAAEGGRAG
jgi:transcriptional regulator with XRE-family HTH domain